VSDNFARVIVADFEYEVRDGELPNVLCMVAYELDENRQHVRTIRKWRGEFDPQPPFDIGPDTLFVAYSAWAEMTCFMVLGWQFPVHIFDLHTAYLAASNVLRPQTGEDAAFKKPKKDLAAACRAYGITGWEGLEKKEIAKDIGEGRWEDHGAARTLEYCEEDVHMSVLLLAAELRGKFDDRARAVLPPADVERVLHWSNYSAKAVARIQAAGMPIDMALWDLVQENKVAVVADLVRRFDPSQGEDETIYTPEGEFSYARFDRWLARNGHAWPRLGSGRLDTDGDAFRMMYHVPGIEDLHALRDSLGVIVRAKLPIGSDGRNRPSLFPFGTATGRNAHSKSLYNAHASVRSFMVFPPDKIGAYLDWRTQEVGIAGVLSGDAALMNAYREGDVYHALALVCGFTTDPNPMHWKKHNGEVRQRMKALQLGINYGMGVPSLARGLDRHPLIASGVIEKHRRAYPRYWQWRDDGASNAMAGVGMHHGVRCMRSVFGWPLYISTSPNKRTLYNFPMQANGAEMLRLAAWRMCELGIVPCMLIHDGILIEAHDRDQVDHAMDIMRAASRDVCDGFEIDVDIDQILERGARYRDKRPVAQRMWSVMMQALQRAGALPEGPLP
jgi:DNA polymerase-1